MKAIVKEITQKKNGLPYATVIVILDDRELEKIKEQKDYINKIKITSIEAVVEEMMK